MPIFSVLLSDIQSLDDRQARELVARLAKADLKLQGIPDSAVAWGGDQRAPDGGIDVRVSTIETVAEGSFAPRSICAFQVKAEHFPASKVAKEMSPAGTLRSEIAELGKSGSYVIVSTKDSCSQTMLAARVRAMEKELTQLPKAKRPRPAFYDARQLTDWAEKHPTIAAWLRTELGKPIQGWQPFGAWAHQQVHVNDSFLLDKDKVRVVLPDGTSGTLADAVASLRNDLAAGEAVRLVGLSGVGKTRLAGALFQSEVEAGSPHLSPETAVYTDLGHEPSPSPQHILGDLLESGTESVLIVDNCGTHTHGRLVDILNRIPKASRRTALLTIEYDVRDDLPEQTRCYQLTGSSDDLIVMLIKQRRFPISELDSRNVAAFSDGNARVALALAETAAEKGQLAELRSSELFDRLFTQSNAPNDDLKWHASVASALYSFDGESDDANSELAKLAALAGAPLVSFQRSLASLSTRGLLQSRGRWRALLPHAIANSLARRLLDTLSTNQLLSALIAGADERTARSFTRRLSYVYDHPRAVEMAAQLLGEHQILGQAASLSGLKLNMFGNLAVVDPNAALSAIERSVSDDQLYNRNNVANSEIKRILRAIAYDDTYFARCANALAAITEREPEGHRYEPARKQLLSLFSASHSGTHATITTRQEVVRSWLSSSNTFLNGLGLEATESALNRNLHHTHFIQEWGSRSRDWGWFPQTIVEAEQWYNSWIELALELASGDKGAIQFRRIAAKALRQLWSWDKVYGVVERVSDQMLKHGPWPEGWRAAREAYYYDGDKWNSDVKARFTALFAKLEPRSLEERIRAQVLNQDSYWDDFGPLQTMREEEDNPSERLENGHDSIQKLGLEATGDVELVIGLLPDLLSVQSGVGPSSFGRGVGRSIEAVSALIPAIEAFLSRCDPSRTSATFVRGMIVSWSQVDPYGVSLFLDRAKDKSAWLPWFVELQAMVELDESAVDRLLEVASNPKCPTLSFDYLRFGRTTEPLSVDQIMALTEAIASRPDGGLLVAVELLRMVVHGTEKKEEAYIQVLKPRVWDFVRGCDWDQLADFGQRLSHSIQQLLTFSMPHSLEQSELELLLTKVAPMEADTILGHDDPRRVVAMHLVRMQPAACLEFLFARDDSQRYWRTLEAIRYTPAGDDRFALNHVPIADLIAWCQRAPSERFPLVASEIPPLEFKERGDDPAGISEAAKALLLAAPDKHAVMQQIAANFRPDSWSGSMASILENRRALLDQFKEPGVVAIGEAVEVAKQNFDRWVAEERAREERENREENLTFE